MSYLCICDVCGYPIPENDKKFVFAVNETKNNMNEQEAKNYDSEMDLQDVIDKLKAHRENITTREICLNCKKVLDYFLNCRVDRVKKLSKILSKLDNKEDSKPLIEGNK